MALWPWITELTLLENTGVDDKHQPYFASAGSQEGWFMGFQAAQYDNYTQLNTEKGWYVMVQGDYEKWLSVDMVTFINKNLGDKRMYAHVIRKEWVNTNVTRFTLELNAFQTFMFDWEIKECFVEREHQTPDFDGAIPNYENLSQEPVQPPDWIIDGQEERSYNNFNIVVAVNTGPGSETDPVPGQMVSNVYTGCEFNYFQDAGAANAFIAQYVSNGLRNSIVSVFMCPFPPSQGGSVDTQNVAGVPTAIQGYTPNNAKTLQYPYCFIEVSNHDGNSIKIAYDYFDDPQSPTFMVHKAMGLAPALMCYPADYKGLGSNFDEGISLSNFPQCSWSSNSFANWYGQNQTAQGIKLLQSLGGLALGNTSPALNQLQEWSIQINQPPETRNAVLTDVLQFSMYLCQFTFKHKTPTREQAERIDSFFTAYGYTTNKTKEPNLRTRPLWNYVKTRDAHVHLGCAKEWAEDIEKKFNNGVTLWHVDNGVEIGDYSRAEENKG